MGTIDRQISEATDQKSLSQYLNQIDSLTTQTEQEQTEPHEGITRRHWREKDASKICFNRKCRKAFTFIDRSYHCYRCGELFCSTCLKFRRKLSNLAHPDPDGKPYKVCQSCYEEGREVEGQGCSLTEEFKKYRFASRFKCQDFEGLQKSKSRRDKVNFQEECRRLISGFQEVVGTSEVRRTLQEVRSMLSIPDWQKSSIWLQENLADSCCFCKSSFGLLRMKSFCRICGLAVCKACSTDDLLVYIPDDREGGMLAQPKIAIIRHLGAPTVEPELSMCLRVCGMCREKIIDQQLSVIQSQEVVGEDFLTRLRNIHQRFNRILNKINGHLPAYQDIVDSLEDNSRRSSMAQKSNVQTLAKAQGDLADHLAEFAITIQLLKKLEPKTGTQIKLLQNYIKSKCEFYLDGIFTFRNLRRRLSADCPPEVLESIQNIMDKNAIISAHLYLLQLAFETLHLCELHGVTENLPGLIAPVEEKVKADVMGCLTRDMEPWDQHQQLSNETLRDQLKNHKLIRPSRRLLQTQGASHVKDIMNLRTQEVVRQITMQLQLKSANRSFLSTKQALEQICQTLAT